MNAPPRPPNLQNLLARGHLKEAVFVPGAAESYFRRAATARSGAALEALDAHDRFIVAYEGLFALVIGVLASHGLRPGDGEGHRAIAVQAVLAVLGARPALVQQVIRLHDLRNAKIYRSPLPASQEDAADALEALDVMLRQLSLVKLRSSARKR